MSSNRTYSGHDFPILLTMPEKKEEFIPKLRVKKKSNATSVLFWEQLSPQKLKLYNFIHKSLNFSEEAACMVRVFTENGIHLRDFGRRGQGPGEFDYPVKIQITSDNELCVSGSRYLIFFSLEGEFIRRINVAFYDLRPNLNSQGNIISRTDILGEKIRWELNKYSKNGEKINTLVELEIVRDLSKYDPYYHIIFYGTMSLKKHNDDANRGGSY